MEGASGNDETYPLRKSDTFLHAAAWTIQSGNVLNTAAWKPGEHAQLIHEASQCGHNCSCYCESVYSSKCVAAVYTVSVRTANIVWCYKSSCAAASWYLNSFYQNTLT